MAFKFRLNRESKYILRRLLNLPNPIHNAINEGFVTWGKELVKSAEDAALNENKYGEWYPNKISRIHRASAAGQTPAYKTGTWNKKLRFTAGSGLELEFGNDAKYAAFLEEGTRKMEARTGLINALNKTERNYQSYYNASLLRNLKK